MTAKPVRDLIMAAAVVKSPAVRDLIAYATHAAKRDARPNRVRLSVSLSADLVSSVGEMAASQSVTKSAIVERALRLEQRAERNRRIAAELAEDDE